MIIEEKWMEEYQQRIREMLIHFRDETKSKATNEDIEEMIKFNSGQYYIDSKQKKG